MKTNLVTLLLFILLPIGLFSQNYEKEGDELYAQAQYEQAEKKYKAAVALVGESQTIKQKQENCVKCKSLLAKAQTAEKEYRYSDAAKHYSDLYAIHSLAKYQSKANALKQKIQKLEQQRLAKIEEEKRVERERQAEQDRLAKERAEKERLAREQAEKERLARERAEKERLARERAEKERLARERAEIERHAKIEAERRAEQEQLAKELAEQKRALREGRAVKGKCGDNLTGDNLTWEYYNGTLTISGKGGMANFRYDTDWPWYKLGFRGEIKSLIISNSVTSIGSYAFYRCTSLTTVTIPNNVTSIGQCAFKGCKKLKLVAPERFHDVNAIIWEIFADCKSVTYY